MIVVDAVAAGGVSVMLASETGGGGVDVDDVPTYVFPGRCETVRNCV